MEFMKDRSIVFLMVSGILFVMSILIMIQCEDFAKALNTGGISCADGEHGAEALYMSASNSSKEKRLVLSYTCQNGKAAFEVRP